MKVEFKKKLLEDMLFYEKKNLSKYADKSNKNSVIISNSELIGEISDDNVISINDTYIVEGNTYTLYYENERGEKISDALELATIS